MEGAAADGTTNLDRHIYRDGVLSPVIPVIPFHAHDSYRRRRRSETLGCPLLSHATRNAHGDNLLRLSLYGPVRREYDQRECRKRARQQNQVRDAAMDFLARLDQGAARVHASLEAISYLTFDT